MKQVTTHWAGCLAVAFESVQGCEVGREGLSRKMGGCCRRESDWLEREENAGTCGKSGRYITVVLHFGGRVELSLAVFDDLAARQTSV